MKDEASKHKVRQEACENSDGEGFQPLQSRLFISLVSGIMHLLPSGNMWLRLFLDFNSWNCSLGFTIEVHGFVSLSCVVETIMLPCW